MSSALAVRDLTVLFGGAAVGLAQVSFGVRKGDCLAILGQSGSGKSSLLRTLAGLQPTIGGTVLANGEDVSMLPPERRDIVYLHQEPVLFPHLSVVENVAFPLVIRGRNAREATARAVEWLGRLQVEDVMHAPPATLSGGQRHRVALARALCAAPAVLLLDEPLASLDPAVRRDVRAALLEVRAASGVAIVLVTHDLEDALVVGTHLAIVDSGTLTPPAVPQVVLEAPYSLAAARVLGVYSEIGGAVRDADGAPVFEWIGGRMPVKHTDRGAAAACVRAHEVIVERGTARGVPSLTVRARRDGAHDTILTLAADDGATVTLRTASGSAVAEGDVVHVSLATARVFFTR